jgi:hypothetical protein
MLKYLIAVKYKDDIQVHIYKFKTMQERMVFAEGLRYRDDVQDISYSQIDREDE